MIDKHVAYIDQAADKPARRSSACRRSSTAPTSAPSRRPAGTNSPSRPRRPHHQADAGPRPHSTTSPSSSRSTRASRRASTTTPPRSSTPTATYLGKYRKTHIPHVAPGFWEKFYFRPGNLGYPVFDLGFGKDRRLHLLRPPFPGRRARPGTERRGDRLQSVGHRRRASASICGSWSSPRTPWPTATSSAPSTASASRRPGTSASSTAPAISATRAARSSRRPRATSDEVLTADLDSRHDRAKSARPGSSSATAARTCTALVW